MNTNMKQKRAKGTKRAEAKELIDQWGRLRFLALKAAMDCQLTTLRLGVLKMRLAEASKSPLAVALLAELDITLKEQEPVAKDLNELGDRILALQVRVSNP